MEDRTTSGLAAMDQLAALAREKDAAMQAAAESGMPTEAFSVAWLLRDDPAVRAAGVDVDAVAAKATELLARYPNARDNPEEKRLLRAGLYPPLMKVPASERARVVELAIKLLLPEDA